MVGGDALRDEAKVAFDDRRGRVFDCPFANIRESFTANGGLLGGFRGSPPVIPSFGELFNKMAFDFRRLYAWDVRKDM